MREKELKELKPLLKSAPIFSKVMRCGLSDAEVNGRSWQLLPTEIPGSSLHR